MSTNYYIGQLHVGKRVNDEFIFNSDVLECDLIVGEAGELIPHKEFFESIKGLKINFCHEEFS